MKRVDVRFYAELNDFLPLWRRKRPTTCYFEVSGSVKDMIEALGVPHTEVDLILANDESVDFSYRVQDGDNQRLPCVRIHRYFFSRPAPAYAAPRGALHR